jgi:hypothetical protein
LAEVDAEGRAVLLEVFAANHLGAAVVRLYERYAELLSEGGVRGHAAATAGALAVLLGPLDLEHCAAVLEPGVEAVDHRRAGFGPGRGAESLLRALASAYQVAEEIGGRVDDVIAATPDALLVRWTTSGTSCAGGGEFEWQFLRLFRFGAGGLLSRYELFEPEHQAEALARFDELASATAAPRFENAATRASARLAAATRDRDFERFSVSFAPAYRTIDRRRSILVELDRDQLLAGFRPIFGTASRLDVEKQAIATRGDRLALFRERLVGEGAGAGPSEVEYLQIIELDERGELVLGVVFDPDDLDAAYEELDRRFDAGEGAGQAELLVNLRAYLRALEDRDAATLRRILPDDFRASSHRPLVDPGQSLSRDEYLASYQGIGDFREVLTRVRLDHVPRLSPKACVFAITAQGTIGGGAFERSVLIVNVHDGHRPRSLEEFDPDQLDAALARFEELSREARAPRIENAATRANEELLRRQLARDWEGVVALQAPDARLIDRRSLIGVDLAGRDYLDNLRVIFDMGFRSGRSELLATRGERLALFRTVSETEDGTAVEFLVITEVDASGRIRLSIGFDLQELDAAYDELDRRYEAGEAAPHARARAIWRRFASAWNARDWNALAAMLAPEFRIEDHRKLGMLPEMSRDDYVASVRALTELRPDVRLWIDHVLAGDGHRWLQVGRLVGAEQDGSFETPFTLVLEFDADATRGFDVFDDLAAARARYDELSREDTRPRIENAATRSTDRFQAALEARDWESIVADTAADFHQIDRRRFVQLDLDRDQHLEWLRTAGFEQRSSEISSEVLATRGDRLALRHVRGVDTDEGVGPSEYEFLGVVEVNDRGERVALVLFDPDALDEAYDELDARYAAGEAAPYARTWAMVQSPGRLVEARDWGQLASLYAPDCVMKDHRPPGLLNLSRDEWVASARALVELRPDVALRADHVLALDHRRMLAIVRWVGSEPEGAFESLSVVVLEIGPDSIRRSDAYALDQLDAARARYDELSREDTRLRIETAATRFYDRFEAACEARDLERIAAGTAPEMRHIDRRGLMQLNLDRGQHLEWMRTAFERNFRTSSEVLATRGDRLALARIRSVESDEIVGPSEHEFLGIVEVNDRGEGVAGVLFDPGDLDAAYDELDARYAAGEAAPHAQTWAAAMRATRAIAARDWQDVASVFAPDFAVDDHRSFGILSNLSRDEWLASVRALFELRPDSSLRIEHVFALDDRHCLQLARWRGNESEGAYEIANVIVWEYSSDGIRRWHVYDLGQLDAARARYDAIGAAALHDPLAALLKPNAATAALDRVLPAWDAEDWSAMQGFAAEDAWFEDRRGHALVSGGTDWWIEYCQLAARLEDRNLRRTLLATAGDRVCVEHVLWTGGPADGRVEVEYLWLAEVDESGRLLAGVMFDVDDRRAANREAVDRWLARDAAAVAVMEPVLELIEGFNDHDRARMRAVLADDVVSHDRQLTGHGRVEGADAYLEAGTAVWALTSDVQLELRTVLALERHGGVGVSRTFGTLPEGGSFEIQNIDLLTVAGGRITRIENFESDAVEAALARLAELRPDPLRIPPNAATRASERLERAFEARDWSALRALATPDFRFDDRGRRALVGGDAETWLRNMQVVREWPGLRQERTMVATAGERLALERILNATDAGEGEFLRIVEVDAEGRLRAVIRFDPDDRRAASVEMAERFAASTVVPWLRASSERRRAIVEHDLEALRAWSPDGFVFDDHRLVGPGRIEGMDAYANWMSSLFEQSHDAIIEPLYFLAMESHAVLGVAHSFGTLPGGGSFENVFAQVISPDCVEIFELEDLDRAWARFEALRPDPLRIPPNAATRAGDRFWACFAEQDWNSLRELCPEIRWEDRRRLIRTTGDCDTVLANAKLISRAGSRVSRTVLATAGDRLALARVLLTGPGDGAASFETEVLDLLEVDAGGRLVALITFDPDDHRAASLELLERLARGGDAPWLNLAVLRAINEHDVDRLRAALPEDFVFDDHRRVGPGRIEGGEAFVAWMKSLFDESRDAILELLYFLAVEPRAALVVAHTFGTLAGGGTFENVFVQVMGPGRVEPFELDDLDRAWARFEELRAPARPAGG